MDSGSMGGREGWDPPIATLPRQQRLAPEAGARWGFARASAKRNRQLGWLLWAGLVGLVLLLSST
jgi:hypothetical protein